MSMNVKRKEESLTPALSQGEGGRTRKKKKEQGKPR
jgi:hypothetical protein